LTPSVDERLADLRIFLIIFTFTRFQALNYRPQGWHVADPEPISMDESLAGSETFPCDDLPQGAGHAVVNPHKGSLLWASPEFDAWLAAGSDSRLTLVVDVARRAREGSVTGAGQLLAYDFELEGERLVLVAWPPPDAPPRATSQESRDPLTGLADRGALETRLQMLERRWGQGPGVALLFIDLDDFKQINDSHGHLVGDKVLATVAGRLTGAVREIDFMARFGGDEFVALVEGIESPEKLAPVVERLRIATQEPIETPSGPVSLSASFGVALSNEGLASPQAMLEMADKRMYNEKRRAP
jgi:diguanylate cyclase (GGDEF)-like protein